VHSPKIKKAQKGRRLQVVIYYGMGNTPSSSMKEETQ